MDNNNMNGYNMSYQQYNQAPQAQAPAPAKDPNTVSTADWFWSMLLLCIPLVNLIMLFVWAFGSSKPSKRNFGKAYLIWMLVGIGISLLIGLIVVLVMIVTGASLATILSEMMYYSGY
ncbi:MAG: hypothetical protein IJ291_07025 [Lachnospiraceae bacterium]|nr:hypothetical protein [Lachnospiraceae bacterium]